MPRKKLTRRQMLLNAAKRQMMDSGELWCREDNRAVPDTLPELYEELNNELFGGELPEDLPVVWNSKLTRALGKAFYSSTGVKTRGKRKDCTPVRIEIQRGHRFTPRFLRKVMTHEMCHIWAYMHHDEVGHGKMFWKKMREVGYREGHRFRNQRPDEADKYCL